MAVVTGLSSETLRARLIGQRQSLLELLDNLRDARKRGPLVECEVVTNLESAAQVRAAECRIADMDEALERLEMGTYGACDGCGVEISPDRLEALPSTGSCRQCA